MCVEGVFCMNIYDPCVISHPLLISRNWITIITSVNHSGKATSASDEDQQLFHC